MIIFIITDSYENFRKGGWLAARNTLEDVARDACVALHYTQATPEIIRRMRPWAVCHSGGNAPYDSYDLLTHPAYRRMVTASNVPQIGFCRGQQVLAHFFGSRLGLIRRLRAGESDPATYQPGWFKEWGTCPVRIAKNDPLFRGCPKVIMVHEAHCWEVKRLAADLICLASSPKCKIQAFRHAARPIYGVQFHPETKRDGYPDGIRVLKNFFRIARAWWRTTKSLPGKM